MTHALLVSQVLLWIGFVGLAIVMAATLRQIGVLFERVAPAGALAMNSRLTVGDNAPKFSVDSLNGQAVKIGEASPAGKSTLLFFLSTDCPVCKELIPTLKSFRRNENSIDSVVFVGSAQETGHKDHATSHDLPLTDYVVSDQVGLAYAVSKLPYAVLIDANGKVAAFGLVNNREHFESLVEAKMEGVASIQDYLKKTA